jgi:hypothetical protein
LKWQRDGGDWLLLFNRRRIGHVVPDSRYPKMYRSVRTDGRLSDMANLSRAKDAANWVGHGNVSEPTAALAEAAGSFYALAATPRLRNASAGSLIALC